MSWRGRLTRSISNGGVRGTPPRVVARPSGLARQGRSTGDAQHISKSRYALWKNPGDLTGRQRHQLEWIAKTDPRLWRAYLLKEGLRYVFAVKGNEGKTALDRWIQWARRSRMPAFVQLQRRIVAHRARDRRRARYRLVARPRRINQHQDPVTHPRRVRVPRTPTTRRPRDARPRLTPTPPPRPNMTHGNNRRASYASTAVARLEVVPATTHGQPLGAHLGLKSPVNMISSRLFPPCAFDARKR